MKKILAILSLVSISSAAFAGPCDQDLKLIASTLTKGKLVAEKFVVGELVEGQYSVSANSDGKSINYVIFTDESCNVLTACKAKADNGEVCWDAK